MTHSSQYRSASARRLWVWTWLVIMPFLSGAIPAAEEAIELPAADGSMQKPLEITGKKGAVMIFYLHDCPICNTYAPEVERLRAAYEPKGFAFYVIQTDAGLCAAAAKKHADEYGLKCPVLLDGTNRLAKFCGATVTPQAAVIGADGKVLYIGRIDDLYADYGKRRTQPTERDLSAALDAVAEGKPAPHAGGPAVGCFITGIKAGGETKK